MPHKDAYSTAPCWDIHENHRATIPTPGRGTATTGHQQCAFLRLQSSKLGNRPASCNHRAAPTTRD